MGKGDKKSRKGKISMGSHGNTRPQQSKKASAIEPEKGADAGKKA